jgi:hypothetical protein
MMKLVCAWCGSEIERSGYDQTVHRYISHGMCPACCQIWLSQERGVSLQCHIDSIPVPILLVDSKNTTLAINTKASEILGVPSEAIGGSQFGSVFDCVHSDLAEGCGRSLHCSGCVIRRSVADTYQTGQPQVAVPATLSVTNSENPSDVVFTITTVRNDKVVLMRIDQVQQGLSSAEADD